MYFQDLCVFLGPCMYDDYDDNLFPGPGVCGDAVIPVWLALFPAGSPSYVRLHHLWSPVGTLRTQHYQGVCLHVCEFQSMVQTLG